MSRNCHDEIFETLFFGCDLLFMWHWKGVISAPKSEHQLANIRLKLPFYCLQLGKQHDPWSNLWSIWLTPQKLKVERRKTARNFPFWTAWLFWGPGKSSRDSDTQTLAFFRTLKKGTCCTSSYSTQLPIFYTSRTKKPFRIQKEKIEWKFHNNTQPPEKSIPRYLATLDVWSTNPPFHSAGMLRGKIWGIFGGSIFSDEKTTETLQLEILRQDRIGFEIVSIGIFLQGEPHGKHRKFDSNKKPMEP